MPGKEISGEPQDVGTAGYGGFAEPAVNAPGNGADGLAEAMATAGKAFGDWALAAQRITARAISAGSTAGLKGNPP